MLDAYISPSTLIYEGEDQGEDGGGTGEKDGKGEGEGKKINNTSKKKETRTHSHTQHPQVYNHSASMKEQSKQSIMKDGSFLGRGIQYYLGFHHMRDSCRGRVSICDYMRVYVSICIEL